MSFCCRETLVVIAQAPSYRSPTKRGKVWRRLVRRLSEECETPQPPLLLSKVLHNTPPICIAVLEVSNRKIRITEVFKNIKAAPLRGRQHYLTFPSAPDPSFKASKAPFLTLRVATVLGAPCQTHVPEFRRRSPHVHHSYRESAFGMWVAFGVCSATTDRSIFAPCFLQDHSLTACILCAFP